MLTLVTLAFATLVSEDLTCVAAGVLVAEGRLHPLAAISACAVGIFGGDFGLWLVGRTGGRLARCFQLVAGLASGVATDRLAPTPLRWRHLREPLSPRNAASAVRDGGGHWGAGTHVRDVVRACRVDLDAGAGAAVGRSRQWFPFRLSPERAGGRWTAAGCRRCDSHHRPRANPHRTVTPAACACQAGAMAPLGVLADVVVLWTRGRMGGVAGHPPWRPRYSHSVKPRHPGGGPDRRVEVRHSVPPARAVGDSVHMRESRRRWPRRLAACTCPGGRVGVPARAQARCRPARRWREAHRIVGAGRALPRHCAWRR